MRLICPNCGAQYEVAEDVIPQAGRDVQCSNCAHTWFETPGASEAREAGQDEAPAVSVVADTTPDQPEAEAVEAPQDDEALSDDTASDADTLAQPQDETPEGWSEGEDSGSGAAEDQYGSSDEDTSDEPEADTEAESAETPADSTPERRPLSPSVAEILREEAAREEARRITDADASIESQPDLGLDRPMDRDEQLAEEARRRMARLKGEAAPAIGAATAVAAGARGEMLPDIDEINSSLRSETERAEDAAAPAAPAEEAKRKSGFRRGFFTVVLLAIIALLIYMFAPQISAAVPALEPALTSYVDTVNQGRLWLDLQLQGLLPGSAE